METLLKFKYKNIWYFVEQDNKTIKYYKLDNKKKNYDLTLEELDTIKYVIDSLTPNGKKIKLMDYLYKGNKYEILLDTKTNLYLFNPMPNYDDFKELFHLFNNRSEFLAFRKKEKKVINDVKPQNHETLTEQLVQMGKVVICAFVSAGLFMGSIFSAEKLDAMNYQFVASQREKTRIIELQKEYIQDYRDYVTGVLHSRKLDDSVAINTIHSSIDENENLTDNEKFLIKRAVSPNYIMRNRDYLNISYVTNKLSTLRINYSKEFSKDKKINGNYDLINNIITLFGVENIEEADLTVFFHEIYHSLKYRSALGNNFYLDETTNCIVNEDYNNWHEIGGYSQIYGFTKAIMEIIGYDAFQEYSFFESTDEITDRLVRFHGTSDDAKALLTKLEIYGLLAVSPIKNEQEKAEIRENLIKLNKEIVEQINIYYRAYMGFDYTDDLIMLFYLDVDEFSRIMKEKYNIPEELHTIFVKKAPVYLNSYTPVLVFNYLGFPEIEINNDNRYLNESMKTI